MFRLTFEMFETLKMFVDTIYQELRQLGCDNW